MRHSASIVRNGDGSFAVPNMKECADNHWGTMHSPPSVLEHLEGASNKARFQICWNTDAGAQTYMAGDCYQDPRLVVAIRSIQCHTIQVPEDRSVLGWKVIPQAEAESRVLYPGTSHVEGIARSWRNRRRAQATRQVLHYAGRLEFEEPIAGLRGGANVVVFADATKCIKTDISFWTNLRGTMLTRGNVPPQCLFSITPIEGAQPWIAVVENA